MQTELKNVQAQHSTLAQQQQTAKANLSAAQQQLATAQKAYDQAKQAVRFQAAL